MSSSLRLLDELHRELDEFFEERRNSADRFVVEVYHRRVQSFATQVTALVKRAVPLTEDPVPEVRVPDVVASKDQTVEIAEPCSDQTGEVMQTIEERSPLKCITTPVPLCVKGSTPRRSKHSFANDELNWGDRVRSHSPTAEIAVQTTLVTKPIPEEKNSIEKEQEVVPIQQEPVKSFSTCVKPPHFTSGQTKSKIPALKRAAHEKKKQEKKELERKNFKDKIREWRNRQNQFRSPTKVDTKPDAQHCGVKRPSELESSVSKKQKLKEPEQQEIAKIKVDGGSHPQTPELAGTQNQATEVDPSSPQYDLTPVGFLHTNYDKKLHRRNKHIPSWADSAALENSMMQQRNKMENLFQSRPGSLNPRRVFGTPDVMVVKNATARAYRYDHRSSSSVDWSDKEDANDNN